jgi:hypothetical protein
MGRRIVWSTYELNERGEEGEKSDGPDGYFDRLLKYIPADVVGIWLTGSGLIQSQAGEDRVGALWLLFVMGLVGSAVWTKKQTKPTESGKSTALRQIALSCGSFAVWVFAIGGPFAELSFYKPFYGSFLLFIYSVVIAWLPAPTPSQQ